jgi:hypothetical protein
MARRAAAPGGTHTSCPGCRAPIHRQTVEALRVTADLTGITPAEETAVRTDPNRLTWCLHPTAAGPARLRWIYPWHPPDCPHPHVPCHRCPPTEPDALF